MRTHFERIAIVNRGEPAVRLIRAVRQFNRENKTQLRTIVLYTEPDRHARFIQEADEAISLGEATYFDVRAGQRKPAYVDHDRVARSLQDCGADAVWVGWGFVSESPEFVELCTQMGLAFIGPDSESMRLLGDKISAKRLAEQVGVQVIPWHGAAADTVEVALQHARTLGYPVVIKATAGSGGRGIRKVESESELEGAFHSARNESRRIFGNPGVFLERWMEGARHVEVQILADCLGTTWAVGTRDCTIQRRHQKIMEEAPAAILSHDQDRALREAAVRICKAAGYRNAGTVEFLFVPDTQQHYFMEVNTRLQVEHAVTELTTGLDLVQLQLYIARGGLLEGQPPEPRGHALEVRLNAEDAEAGFAPAPGRIELFRVPTQAGLRLDSGVSEGDAIPAEFDSMFAKLISHGQTRVEALAGVTQALEESAIMVAGGATNRAFLLQLLEREEVKHNRLDVGWLDRQTAAGGHVTDRHADIALLKAAIDVYDSEFEAEREQFLASALRMRPVVRTEAGRLIELRHRGHLYKFQVFKHSMEHYRIDIDGASFHIEINPGGRFEQWLTYPYEIIRTLTPKGEAIHAELPPGMFIEYDLDENGKLVPANRPYGCNTANIVVGLIRNFTAKYPEGMTRVILLGDPSKEVGSIAEPECRRIIAALDLAQERNLPLEWFTHSAGAKISMASGTENMDWIAKVLRRLIDFTQAGCEVNVVVAGINVGAQPYWNAEATMLMHTRGILVMMPESAMVLTGKIALDYSGSVSAEDNLGIGGYDRVMGPNGQAQYWARDLAGACQILMRHYDHTYVMPGERFPRRAVTEDPADRDVCMSPHASNGEGFALVGDIFSDEHNPGRKKPFEIRKVMLAVADCDLRPLERWPGMEDAEISVVWDAHIGGYPVCLLGFESRPLPRTGFVATDGPEQWTSGTLFPLASKKTARAINAATNNRPLVILANLSGFDGSPESMRRHQLEFGAEIGRAIVNFKGPIVFCVISRYHGGAFVVFSRVLNENLEAIALEGTYASVIGGAPAAAVVFAREVDKRTRADARIASLEKEISAAADAQKRRLRAKLAELRNVVRSEKLGEVADEFDHIHSVHRALEVGSLNRIIPASQLRPYLIDAIERGMKRELERISGSAKAAETHS